MGYCAEDAIVFVVVFGLIVIGMYVVSEMFSRPKK